MPWTALVQGTAVFRPALSVPAATLGADTPAIEEPAVDQDRTPQELAQDAADTIQALTEATSAASAFHGEGDYVPAAPSNIAKTITGLNALADQLSHTLRNASRALQVLEEQQQIRTADGSDVGDQVSRVLRGLLDAQQAFQLGHVHLREAGVPLALLGGHYDPADDDELEDTPATT